MSFKLNIDYASSLTAYDAITNLVTREKVIVRLFGDELYITYDDAPDIGSMNDFVVNFMVLTREGCKPEICENTSELRGVISSSGGFDFERIDRCDESTVFNCNVSNLDLNLLAVRTLHIGEVAFKNETKILLDRAGHVYYNGGLRCIIPGLKFGYNLKTRSSLAPLHAIAKYYWSECTDKLLLQSAKEQNIPDIEFLDFYEAKNDRDL